jgi:hypothetical protein
LGEVPAFVASLEAANAWTGSAGPTLVAAPRPAPAPPQAAPPPDWSVTLTGSGRTLACRVLTVAATHLVLDSPSPAPENLLLRMTVGCSPPLSCFATVKRSSPGPGGHRLELQPYALAGEVLARWKGLVAEAAGA